MITEKEYLEAQKIVDAYKEQLRIADLMRSRFNKGDIVICCGKGGSYGDKFTVLEDTGGLTLLCHKTGGLCIVNNRDHYDYA